MFHTKTLGIPTYDTWRDRFVKGVHVGIHKIAFATWGISGGQNKGSTPKVSIPLSIELVISSTSLSNARDLKAAVLGTMHRRRHLAQEIRVD